MNRRRLLPLLAAALWPAAIGLAEGKPPRVGYLWIGPEGSDGATLDGIRRGFAELGYLEGRTLLLERRYADGQSERLPGLAAELVALPVDVVASPGTLVTRAFQRATKTIPVVATTGDPVGSGFVANLARPGGNITGLSIGPAGVFAGKWLELLKEAVPGLVQVAVLHDAQNPSIAQQVDALVHAARALGVVLVAESATTAEELGPALTRLAASTAGALVVTDSPLFAASRQRLIGFAADRRWPAMYGTDEFVAVGGLMSYSANLFEIWRRAAGYVDRILKGADPATMPVEEPTAYQLKINLRTARALGLELPRALLLRAEEVIE